MAKRKIGYYIERPGANPDDPPITIPIAADLLTEPGIPKRDAEISYYSREFPIDSVAINESASAQWSTEVRDDVFPDASELYQEYGDELRPLVEWIKSTGDLEPTAEPTGEDVTESIRKEARALGYGEVGFAKLDRRYVYQSRRKDLKGSLRSAICLALEQDYTATQAIPSRESEAAQGDTYIRQGVLTKKLVEHILSLGYRVKVSGPTWHFGAMIPMFVDAGLGQLGANVQLLSPHFGSRARLQIILTDAKISYDKPMDYGIPKYCELCQVCVNRCPGRALEPQKVWYRGVEKNKVAFQRCRPVMARYMGCGICIKTCPIQKYGMKPVMEYYVETGDVLGKTTDDLEGYTLPDKGYMAPRKLPSFSAEFFDMPRGRADEWLMGQLVEDLEHVDGDQAARQHLLDEFQEKLATVMKRSSDMADMGMDMAE